MANEKPAAAPPAPAEDKDAPKKKGGMKTMIVAAAVVLLEVGTVFVTIKMASGPKQVTAMPVTTAAAEIKVEKDVEVKILADKLPNNQNGRLYLYDLVVVAKASEKDKEHVTELFAEHEAEIKDHLRIIVASSDPKSLAEPGLETLRRQIHYQLEHDIGKDLVKEILIPKCTPFWAQ